MGSERCIQLGIVLLVVLFIVAIAIGIYNITEINKIKDDDEMPVTVAPQTDDDDEVPVTDGRRMQQNVYISSENPKGSFPAVFYDGTDEEIPRGQKKCIIVSQEWWGMNEQIIAQGKQIAEDGKFASLVIDFYRGQVAQDFENARHYSGSLDWPGAVQDMKAGAEYLLRNGCKKVGITGFCMGGSLSLAAAASLPNTTISASAPFYGIPNENYNLANIKVPVSMNFGTRDTSYPKERYDAAYNTMKNAGVDVVLYEYDAGHSFMNIEGARYCQECAQLANQRLYDFFHTNLE